MTRRIRLPALLAMAAIAVTGEGIAQEASAGRTDLSRPEAIIVARQALMTEMERLMRPIDSLTVGEPIEAEEVRSSAASILPMLLATPHLFPPTTDLYDEAEDAPVTIALPSVWESFPAFYAMAVNAADAAESLSSAREPAQLQAGATGLRGTCDACHALYLLPYEPSGVTSEDLNFDFDALFEDIENAPDAPQ